MPERPCRPGLSPPARPGNGMTLRRLALSLSPLPFMCDRRITWPPTRVWGPAFSCPPATVCCLHSIFSSVRENIVAPLAPLPMTSSPCRPRRGCLLGSAISAWIPRTAPHPTSWLPPLSLFTTQKNGIWGRPLVMDTAATPLFYALFIMIVPAASCTSAWHDALQRLPAPPCRVAVWAPC